MKINIIIRAYTPENLLISLFDIPNKISSDLVDIYVHNDNPEKEAEYLDKLNQFTSKYPEYSITSILEKDNQSMLMSLLNTFPYLNKDNKFTLVLDDDDTLCKLGKKEIARINTHSENEQLVYKCKFIEQDRPIKICQYTHKLRPTALLNWIGNYKEDIKSLLLEYAGTYKITYGEEMILDRLIKIRPNIKDITLSLVLLNHNIYEHTIGDYTSGGSFYMQRTKPMFVTNTTQKLKEIIQEKEPELLEVPVDTTNKKQFNQKGSFNWKKQSDSKI